MKVKSILIKTLMHDQKIGFKLKQAGEHTLQGDLITKEDEGTIFSVAFETPQELEFHLTTQGNFNVYNQTKKLNKTFKNTDLGIEELIWFARKY